MDTDRKTIAIVLAAGSGSRLDGPVPKQFRKLDGRPVYGYAIQSLRRSADQVYVVFNADHVDHVGKGEGQIFCGGRSRLVSLWNALDRIKMANNDRILIHDGVRPFPGIPLIGRLLRALDSCDGAVPVLPVHDSLMRPDKLSLVDRNRFCLVQTPQAFRREVLMEAMERSGRVADGFCEFEIVRRFCPDARLTTVPGERTNFKITTIEDLEMARILARGSNF